MANGISHSVASLMSQGLSRRMPYPFSVSPEEVAERAVTADSKRQRTPKLALDKASGRPSRETVDLMIKPITSPRALPISRGLHQRHVSRDSMKSAFAIPTTRTLLIWGRGGKSVSLLLGITGLTPMLADWQCQSLACEHAGNITCFLL
jgi:hypothetical protein